MAEIEIAEDCIREALTALEMSPDAPLNAMSPSRRAEVLSVARYLAQKGEERESWRGLRVIRVLEYVYADAQTMEQDMANWEVQGTRQFSSRARIRSATLPLEVLA
jgi:hypothetical protein